MCSRNTDGNRSRCIERATMSLTNSSFGGMVGRGCINRHVLTCYQPQLPAIRKRRLLSVLVLSLHMHVLPRTYELHKCLNDKISV